MVVLAVLLYCLVPSGCPIGHIVYLWTLTVVRMRSLFTSIYQTLKELLTYPISSFSMAIDKTK